MIESEDSLSNNEGFFDRPEVIKWMLRIFYSICIVLVIVDFIIHRHIVTDVEKIPAFYAIYGFVACVLLVLVASQMRKLLMRGEHYYTNAEGLSKNQLANNADELSKKDDE